MSEQQVTSESFETGIAVGTISEFLAEKIKQAEAEFGMQAAVVVMLGNDDKVRTAFVGITPLGAADLCVLGAEGLRDGAEEIAESMRKDREAL
jgi:hypothetical protein